MALGALGTCLVDVGTPLSVYLGGFHEGKTCPNFCKGLILRKVSRVLLERPSFAGGALNRSFCTRQDLPHLGVDLLILTHGAPMAHPWRRCVGRFCKPLLSSEPVRRFYTQSSYAEQPASRHYAANELELDLIQTQMTTVLGDVIAVPPSTKYIKRSE